MPTRIVEPVPDGLLFDTDQKVSPTQLRALLAMGFKGGIRYVGLHGPEPEDLDAAEVDLFMEEGAGLLVVQHALDPGWKPTASLGTALGQTAAGLARTVGYLPGATIFDDLEGIAAATPAPVIAGCCNAKLQAVGASGYPLGEYIGAESWLDSTELFLSLDTTTYWKSLSRVPDVDVRGYALEQLATWTLRALGLSIDVNGMQADRKGGRPTWMRQAA